MNPARSLHLDRPLAARLGEGPALGNGLLAGSQRADQLDHAHDRSRVEEVEAAHPVRPAGRQGQLGHRQGGGVGGQDDAVGADAVELLEELALGGKVLDDGLDHQVARRQVVEVAGGDDPREDGVELLAGDLPPVDLLGQGPFEGDGGRGPADLSGRRDRTTTSQPARAATSAIPAPMTPETDVPKSFHGHGPRLPTGNQSVTAGQYGNDAMRQRWWAPGYLRLGAGGDRGPGFGAAAPAAGRQRRGARPPDRGGHRPQPAPLPPRAGRVGGGLEARCRHAHVIFCGVPAQTSTVPFDAREEAIGDADLPEGGFDTIVATFVLCSVEDPGRAVTAIAGWLAHRAAGCCSSSTLPPSGCADGCNTPLCCCGRGLVGGCHLLDRDTLSTLRAAGLSVSDCDRFALPAAGPLFASCVQGVAWRPPIGEPDSNLSVLRGSSQ